MTNTPESLKMAVHELLNDVIEQGFHHLVSHPQQSDELNKIIKDATDELNYQLLKVDSHNFAQGSKELLDHYQFISHDTQRKSLDLLARLQKIQWAENPRLKRI
ncbi:MAG: hypothetical protein ACKVOR_06225 [Flavobacteriales bacterium]